MLCLDIGNSDIHGGLFDGQDFLHSFRLSTKSGWSTHAFCLFFSKHFGGLNVDLSLIQQISISSVVPSINDVVRRACVESFNLEPFFVTPEVAMNLDVSGYQNAREMGADIIAGSVAAVDLYPNKNILVIDLGTATTIVAINSGKQFCGGVIMPGLQTQIDSLTVAAEKLSAIEIALPECVTGKSTTHAIQAGIYFSHLESMRGIAQRMARENFAHSKADFIIGTGGFASLFHHCEIFDVLDSNLVLKGLVILERMRYNTIYTK